MNDVMIFTLGTAIYILLIAIRRAIGMPPVHIVIEVMYTFGMLYTSLRIAKLIEETITLLERKNKEK